MQRKLLKKIEKFAYGKVKDNDFNHNIDHVERTVKLAMFLAKKENANVEVCRIAALLHDIAHRSHYENHEVMGAKMAKNFLKSLKIDNTLIKEICHAIGCHATSLIHKAKTKEAKIVHDADKLQTLGPFGFYRVFGGELIIHKLEREQAFKIAKRLEKERYNLLQTKTAKKLIKEPHKLMLKFYKEYEKWDKVKF